MNSKDKIVLLEMRVNKLEQEVALLKKMAGGNSPQAIAEDVVVAQDVVPTEDISNQAMFSGATNPQPVDLEAESTQTVDPEIASTQPTSQVAILTQTVNQVAAPARPTIVDTSYSGRLAAAAASGNTAVQGRPASQNAQQRAVNTARPMPRTPEVKKSLEDKIGKNLMGIVASVLVFFSLILLGLIIYESLADVIKIAAMYVLSLGFTAFGLIKMKKSDGYKTFYTAVAGCGMGATYISLILTHYVFEALPAVPLVVLLLIWTVFAAVLARFRSPIFTYICFAGIAISTLLCASQWNDAPISLIFYVIGMGVLFGLNHSKEYNNNAFYLIQLPIMALILTLMYSDNLIIASLILLCVVVALIAQNLAFKFDKTTDKILIPVTVISYILMATSMVILEDLIPLDLVKYGFAALFIMIAALYYFTHTDEEETGIAFVVTFYITAVLLVHACTALLWVLAVGLLVIGIFKNVNHCRYTGYAYLFLSIVESGSMLPSNIIGDDGAIAIVIISAIIIAAFVICRRKGDIVDKYALTALMLCVPFSLLGHDIINSVVTLLLIGTISLVCNTDAFRKNALTGQIEKSSQVISYVINGMTILTFMHYIRTSHDALKVFVDVPGTEWVATILMIAMGVAVVLINTTKLFETGIDQMPVGIYIGIKITLMIHAILSRFEAAGFLISIIGIALAVLFVVLGFKFKTKPYRVYGLALSLVCVAKLILVDIHYSTSLLRPLGFLGAGVLCFGISWIYSRLEKMESAEADEVSMNIVDRDKIDAAK